MKEIFEKFNSLNVLIIGDVMMDSYIWGKTERISPEAPVPIVRVTRKENRLGGAANVALNVQSLGARPYICAVIGEDPEGDEFLSLLDKQNLNTEGILRITNRPTTVKTRIIAQNQQIVRIDAETETSISDLDTESILVKIKSLIDSKNISAIIFEDYDKGLISKQLIDVVVQLARKNNIVTAVDPKKRNFLDYTGVNLFKPNLKELKEGLKIEIDPANIKDVEEAVNKLKAQLGVNSVMLTLSEQGVFISSDTGKKHYQAHKRDIADVSGAGDTVIATTALCLAAGLDVFKTAEIANLAGGLVCEHVGVVPIDKSRLLAESEKLGS